MQAAFSFGEAQRRISNLLNGELSRFSVDKIIILLAQAGRHVRVQVTPRQRGDLYNACGSRVKVSLTVYLKFILLLTACVNNTSC